MKDILFVVIMTNIFGQKYLCGVFHERDVAEDCKKLTLDNLGFEGKALHTFVEIVEITSDLPNIKMI